MYSDEAIIKRFIMGICRFLLKLVCNAYDVDSGLDLM